MKYLFFNEKKYLSHMVCRLCNIIYQNTGSMLEESLALICPYFEDAELTIYDCKEECILASTALNIDVLDAIKYEARSLVKRCVGNEIMQYDTSCKKLRPGVEGIVVVPLCVHIDIMTVLCIEFFSGFEDFPFDKLKTIFELLAIAVQICMLTEKSDSAIGRDKATNLLTRDALLDRLNELIEKSEAPASLGIISLSNAAILNKNIGLAVVDEIIRGIGIELKNQMSDSVYRVGGTKFAVIFLGDVLSAFPIMENLVDRILMLDKRIITSNVLTPVVDNAYKTLYICESYLKRADEDVVTVVRTGANIDFEEEYKHVQETYFSEPVPAPVVTDVSTDNSSNFYEEKEKSNFVKDKPLEGSDEIFAKDVPKEKNENIHVQDTREDDFPSNMSEKSDGMFTTSGMDDIEPPEYAFSLEEEDDGSEDCSKEEIPRGKEWDSGVFSKDVENGFDLNDVTQDRGGVDSSEFSFFMEDFGKWNHD